MPLQLCLALPPLAWPPLLLAALPRRRSSALLPPVLYPAERNRCRFICCRLHAGSSAAPLVFYADYTPVHLLPVHLRCRFIYSTSASAAASAALFAAGSAVAWLSSIVAGSSPHGRLYYRIVILGCCSALSAYRVAPEIRETLDCECTGQASLHVRWVQLWALEVRLPQVSQRPWSSASPD